MIEVVAFWSVAYIWTLLSENMQRILFYSLFAALLGLAVYVFSGIGDEDAL